VVGAAAVGVLEVEPGAQRDFSGFLAPTQVPAPEARYRELATKVAASGVGWVLASVERRDVLKPSTSADVWGYRIRNRRRSRSEDIDLRADRRFYFRNWDKYRNA
jgi:hypothetical protein